MEMRILWSPALTFAADTARFSQPEPGVLRIQGRVRGEAFDQALDFRADEDGKWTMTGHPFILSARRVDGVVEVYATRTYLSGESLWWDTGDYIDYGDQVDLMGRPGVEDGTD